MVKVKLMPQLSVFSCQQLQKISRTKCPTELHHTFCTTKTKLTKKFSPLFSWGTPLPGPTEASDGRARQASMSAASANVIDLCSLQMMRIYMGLQTLLFAHSVQDVTGTQEQEQVII